MGLLYLPLAQQHSAGDVAGIHRTRSSVIGRPPFQQPKYATQIRVETKMSLKCIMIFGSSKRQFFAMSLKKLEHTSVIFA